MITKEQIKEVSEGYLCVDEQRAFAVGAQWAVEKMQAENARLLELLDECRVAINKAISGIGYLDETLPDRIKDALI